MENTTQCTPDLSTLILDHSEHFRHLRRQPRLSKTRRDMAHRIHCHTAESSVHNRVWLDGRRQACRHSDSTHPVAYHILGGCTCLDRIPYTIPRSLSGYTRHCGITVDMGDRNSHCNIAMVVSGDAYNKLDSFKNTPGPSGTMARFCRNRPNERAHAMASAYTCVVGMLLLPALCRILRIPVYH